MVKKVKFEVMYSNRTIYTLILIGILIVGSWIVYAVVPNPGHPISSIESPAGCSNNQFLQWNATSGSWVCASVTGGVTPVFGNWEVKIAGTTYLASTDGIVLAWQDTQNGCWTFGNTDNNNPPTTTRVMEYDLGSITMPVRKGDYWMADCSCGAIGTKNVRWIPLGS